METYTLSFNLCTDLDPSQLLGLLEEAAKSLNEEVESYGGSGDNEDLVEQSCCVAVVER